MTIAADNNLNYYAAANCAFRSIIPTLLAPWLRSNQFDAETSGVTKLRGLGRYLLGTAAYEYAPSVALSTVMRPTSNVVAGVCSRKKAAALVADDFKSQCDGGDFLQDCCRAVGVDSPALRGRRMQKM